MLAGGRPCSSSPAWRILTALRLSGASSFDPGANSGLPETACRPLLLALAHGSPSSSSPPWGHLMPPRPYRASSFNLGSSTTTLPAPCGAPSASCGRGAGCCALLLAVAMATATGTPTPTPTPHATPRNLIGYWLFAVCRGWVSGYMNKLRLLIFFSYFDLGGGLMYS